MTGAGDWAARLRQIRPIQAAAGCAWGAAIAGFSVYLASLGSFKDAYGSVGTGFVLLLWVTLFSVLYHVTPDMRPPRRSPLQAAADRVDRVVIPSAALRNTPAQGRMMSVLGPRAAGLSERELELMDWGFAFGVAWAVVRHQDPAAGEELVSRRALQATRAVYEEYRGASAPGLGCARGEQPHGGRKSASAADQDSNGRGGADAPDTGTQHEAARVARKPHPP